MRALQTTNQPEATDDGNDPDHVTVAVAWPLSSDQLSAVQAALGTRYTVEDVRRASPDCTVVLVPPCGPGTLNAVLDAFPRAQVLVVEVDSGPDNGPVGRALTAGASGYARTAGAAGLADAVRWAETRLAA